jgi:16S rRNA processing protein RimM
MATRRRERAADLICLGVVTGPRGLHGEVRIRSFTADPDDVARYGTLCDEAGGRSFRVRVTGRSKGQLVARIEGVEDRDAAEALKGVRLHAPREVLPDAGEGEYYHADLIGLRADLATGAAGGPLGVVRAVYDFGAGPVLEIDGDRCGVVMVPFTRAVVPEVDVAGGRIVIDPPPGLFDAPESDEGATGAPAGKDEA